MIPAQATIAGYYGKPCTLFSAYDENAMILVVSVEADYRRTRRDGCMIITNDPDLERDLLFTEDDIKPAIEAYYSMSQGMSSDGKSSKLTFTANAQRANPAQSIDKDGMDSNGSKYRVSENISCAHIAALATCWYFASRFNTVQKMLTMADSLLDLETLNRGGILTI